MKLLVFLVYLFVCIMLVGCSDNYLKKHIPGLDPTNHKVITQEMK